MVINDDNTSHVFAYSLYKFCKKKSLWSRHRIVLKMQCVHYLFENMSVLVVNITIIFSKTCETLDSRLLQMPPSKQLSITRFCVALNVSNLSSNLRPRSDSLFCIFLSKASRAISKKSVKHICQNYVMAIIYTWSWLFYDMLKINGRNIVLCVVYFKMRYLSC